MQVLCVVDVFVVAVVVIFVVFVVIVVVYVVSTAEQHLSLSRPIYISYMVIWYFTIKHERHYAFILEALHPIHLIYFYMITCC